MRLIITSALLLLIFTGCSGVNQPLAPDVRGFSEAQGKADNHWLWGFWQFYIPADRSPESM